MLYHQVPGGGQPGIVSLLIACTGRLRCCRAPLLRDFCTSGGLHLLAVRGASQGARKAAIRE
eukprot:15437640-Alexandrium_andersonii.AAC.1